MVPMVVIYVLSIIRMIDMVVSTKIINVMSLVNKDAVS